MSLDGGALLLDTLQLLTDTLFILLSTQSELLLILGYGLVLILFAGTGYSSSGPLVLVALCGCSQTHFGRWLIKIGRDRLGAVKM